MALTAEPFGALPDGLPVMRYTLSQPSGLTLRVLTDGGIVQSLEVPDARGRVVNVVLGFASLHGYLEATDAYFGGLVGRLANRLEDFDSDAYFGGKGFGFVRLNQLALEHLLGAR